MIRKDYDINDCYNHFINKAVEDKLLYEKEILDNKEKINYLLEILNKNKDKIESKFYICLDDYLKIDDSIYDKIQILYEYCKKYIKSFEDDESIKLINCILKYCDCVKRIKICKEHIEACNKRTQVTFHTYKKLLKKYYSKVAEVALKGDGVRFSNGLGIFVINYEKKSILNSRKTIDFQATNKAKQELLKRGLKPYNKQEAEEYKRAGITYDGIDCTVYKDSQYRLSVDMIAPTAFKGGMLKISPVNNIPADLRGISYQEFADRFTEKELNNRNLYILARAEINLKRNPLNYLRYNHKINV